jgi:long-chain fatty acid transport protein
MMKMRAKDFSAIFLFLILAVPAICFGSGFYTADQSAKATGLGTANVASVDDASAAYFNPAALADLDGAHLMSGVTVYDISGRFKSDNGPDDELENALIPLPYLHAAYKTSEKSAIGLAVVSDFGLATDWEDDWDGRFITGATYADSMAITVNPVFAYEISPRISVAAGPVLRYFSFDLQNQVPNLLGGYGIGPAVAETGSQVEGEAWGYGFSVALKARLTESIEFGVSYRSKTEHTLSGDFTIDDQGVNGYTNCPIEAEVTLPAYADIGLSWHRDRWTVSAAVLWTQWSAYDELKVTFGQTQGIAGLNQADGYSMSTRWDDTWTYKLGVEYALNPTWSLRSGIIYDPTPVPDDTLDPLVPVGDRLDFTFGLGFYRGAWHIDAAYLLVTSEDRRFDNANGDFSDWGMATVSGEFEDFVTHALAISASYRF